jgi:hypothetical protein
MSVFKKALKIKEPSLQNHTKTLIFQFIEKYFTIISNLGFSFFENFQRSDKFP